MTVLLIAASCQSHITLADDDVAFDGEPGELLRFSGYVKDRTVTLENFDAIGRFRTKQAGQPIDAKGELPGGVTSDGPAELKFQTGRLSAVENGAE